MRRMSDSKENLKLFNKENFETFSVSKLHHEFVRLGNEESDFSNEKASLIFEKASKAIKSNPKEERKEYSYFALRSLGKTIGSSHEEDFFTTKNAVNSFILSSKNAGISIKRNDGKTDFLLFGQDLQQNDIQNTIGSWTRFVDSEPYEYKEAKKIKRSAVCVKIPNEEKNEKTFAKNWISAIINGNFSEDFEVRIEISESDKNNIKEKIQELSKIRSELCAINDVNLNVTVGENNGTSGSSINPLQILGKTNSSSDGTASSVAFSQTLKSAFAKFMADVTDAKINTLSEALLDVPMALTIICEAETEKTIDSLTAIISASLSKEGLDVSWKNYDGSSSAIISKKEVGYFFHLPEKDFFGFERKEIKEFAVNSEEKSGIPVGRFFQNEKETENVFFLNKNNLCRHTSIFGMTGGGKTNTVFHILSNTDAPFLVIEPVKSEYRRLANKFSDLSVYHTNPNENGVMQINPFWFPENSSISFHIDALKKIISSAFSLYAAMPNILEQCLYKCYLKKGWNIIKNSNAFSGEVPSEYLYPTFNDLCTEIETYLAKSDFEGETLSTYKGALLSRLQAFTNGIKGVLLNTANHPDYDKISKSNSIIELDGLSDDSDKSIVMGSLLIQYFQFLKAQKRSINKLSHITVIEEAHRLFKNVESQPLNQETASPEAQLVDTLSNMMAEIRAYGEGLIIVDQNPYAVSENVISNSATKIIHRLDSKRAIEHIESSLLEKELTADISSLSRGEALVRTDGMKKPAKLKIYLSDVKDKDDSALKENGSNIEGAVATADYIMSDESFLFEGISETNKLINHLLYDDLNNSKSFFGAYIHRLSQILFSHGYSELAKNEGKPLYLHITSECIKKAIDYQNVWQNEFKIKFHMFSQRLCEIVSNDECKKVEILSFVNYRSEVIYPLIEVKNRSSGAKEKGIAIACGYYSIYTDLIYELSQSFDDEAMFRKKRNELTVEYFSELISKQLRKIFIISPDEFVLKNLALLLRTLYLSIL